MTKHRVLFLGSCNSGRSQMAEAFLNQYGADQFEVYSAGMDATGLDPYAIQVMDEKGIDIRGQRSKDTTEFMAKMFFHFVITVCADADKVCPQALWAQGGRKIHWPFENPTAVEGGDDVKVAAFREVRDQIDARIKTWLEERAAEKANA